MSKPKLKKSYLIGFGYPVYFRSGLDEGIIFYSDRDTRLSNTRDTHWPDELNIVGRKKVPHYELVLRQCSPKKKRRIVRIRRSRIHKSSIWGRIKKAL